MPTLPPGTGIVVYLLVSSCIGFAFTSAAVIGLTLANAKTSTLAIAQLTSIGLLIPGLVIPGIMLSRGKKWFSQWLRIFVGLTAAAATVTAVLIVAQTHLGQATPLVITGILWGNLILTYRPQFIVFCEYFYRLKH